MAHNITALSQLPALDIFSGKEIVVKNDNLQLFKIQVETIYEGVYAFNVTNLATGVKLVTGSFEKFYLFCENA